MRLEDVSLLGAKGDARLSVRRAEAVKRVEAAAKTSVSVAEAHSNPVGK